MNQQKQSLYSQIPSIDCLLQQPAIAQQVERVGLHLVVSTLRQLQTDARQFIAKQQCLPKWHKNWDIKLSETLQTIMHNKLQPVLNLTGTVLHTNLGRALLAEQAIESVNSVMRHAVTLEYDLDDATRGHRDHPISELLCKLTGAEAACIVNNNAAAVLLMLATVAMGKQVIVSRGELVEIGGAFRIPDVMRQAGCQLVEVGTTNRTHLHDYQQAISEDTALLMKVHTSNYAIQGFSKSVSEAELVELAAQHQLPVIVDLGSGSLIDLQQFGLPKEPMPQALITTGVDLISFSGDKLLGGPQAGIIIGKKHWIDKIQKHPLKRALRVGKLTLAALEATLRLYLQPDKLQQQLPTLYLLTKSQSDIQIVADKLLPQLQMLYAEHFIVQSEPCLSQIGSGSLPIDRLPSYALTFSAKDGRGSRLEALAQRWRQAKIPVIGRIQEGKLWLDLRCLTDETLLLEQLR